MFLKMQFLVLFILKDMNNRKFPMLKVIDVDYLKNYELLLKFNDGVKNWWICVHI